jgi:tripartite-type tricarboxylate transporter receptor subunit TctC
MQFPRGGARLIVAFFATSIATLIAAFTTLTALTPLATLALAAFTFASAFSTPARAQDAYPTKPVRLVVSYAPGNVTDVLARIVAEKLAERWGQSVVVDNRAGQGGSLGAASVAHVPADGYTLLFSAMAAFGINPHVYKSVGYEVKDFTPIVGVAYPRGVLVAGSGVKANTLAELVQLGKSNPGTLNYGTAGSGTVPHLNMEALKAQTGLIAEHVPYKSASAVLTDVIGGRLQLQQETLGVLLPQIKAGKLKPIVAMSDKRLPQLPEVPAIGEVLPGFEPITPWLGILAPAGLPQPIIDKIHRDVDAIIRTPAITEKLAANGMDLLAANPGQFARLIRNDNQRVGKLARALKLQVD